MLGNRPNQRSKFITKNWAEINDDARGTYNTNSQIEFKTSMLKSNLCGYSDIYIYVVGAGEDTAAIAVDRINKEAIFKTCALYTDCIT